MKHSSGPWEVRPVDSRQPQLAIFQTGARKSSGRIATVPLLEGRRDLCTRDAMLIAAAPDLLAVSIDLAESASYWSDPRRRRVPGIMPDETGKPRLVAQAPEQRVERLRPDPRDEIVIPSSKLIEHAPRLVRERNITRSRLSGADLFPRHAKMVLGDILTAQRA